MVFPETPDLQGSLCSNHMKSNKETASKCLLEGRITHHVKLCYGKRNCMHVPIQASIPSTAISIPYLSELV